MPLYLTTHITNIAGEERRLRKQVRDALKVCKKAHNTAYDSQILFNRPNPVRKLVNPTLMALVDKVTADTYTEFKFDEYCVTYITAYIDDLRQEVHINDEAMKHLEEVRQNVKKAGVRLYEFQNLMRENGHCPCELRSRLS